MTADELEARLIAAGKRVTLAQRVDEATAAEVLGCHVRTLRGWRADGRSPKYRRLNGSIWYDLEALVDWRPEGDRG